jgi:hypothetical protein
VRPRLWWCLPPALVAPSVLWLARDRSVWPWDQAWYGYGTVELFYALVRAPARWPAEMLAVLEGQAPGVTWVGQWFVPLGLLLGSIDDGLLVSILVTQALTLAAVYRGAVEVAGRHSVALAAALLAASAPLFVGLSHQYFTEPLQLLAVSVFVLIMCAAPRRPPAFTLAALAAASGLALLAKVSSPVYCVGPALVALRYALRRPLPLAARAWREPRTAAAAVVALLLAGGAAGWYRRNLAFVTEHVRAATSGPIAEIYGGSDSFLRALAVRVAAFGAALFRPRVAVAAAALLAAAVVLAAVASRRGVVRDASPHLRTVAGTAALQIVLVLCVLALSPNGEPRFLLALLPHAALLLACFLARAGSMALSGAAVALFTLQLAVVHAQGLGALPMGGSRSPWLLPPRTQEREAKVLEALAWRTCRGTAPRPQRYWNIVGIELPWMNKNSASYSAAKAMAPHGLVGCRFDSVFSFTVFDPDELWRRVTEMDLRYYVTLAPESRPIPRDDSHLVAVNRNYRPLLERLRGSGDFVAEPPLAEAPDLLVFRRVRSEDR